MIYAWVSADHEKAAEALGVGMMAAIVTHGGDCNEGRAAQKVIGLGPYTRKRKAPTSNKAGSKRAKVTKFKAQIGRAS